MIPTCLLLPHFDQLLHLDNPLLGRLFHNLPALDEGGVLLVGLVVEGHLLGRGVAVVEDLLHGLGVGLHVLRHRLKRGLLALKTRRASKVALGDDIKRFFYERESDFRERQTVKRL